MMMLALSALESNDVKYQDKPNLLTALRMYISRQKLTANEVRRFKQHLPTLEDLTKTAEVSYIVYGLELLRHWAEKTGIPSGVIAGGYKKKSLLLGSKVYTMQLIDLKHRDTDKYSETKAVIVDSELLAKEVADKLWVLFGEYDKEYYNYTPKGV